MEAIANAVGMSKRTVYAKYEDKAALFRASVRRAIERYTIPREALAAVGTEDIETALAEIARIRIRNLMTPNSIKLQRILSAQAHRFPELFHAAFDEGAGPTIAFLSDLFEQKKAAGEIVVDDPRWAAGAFLSLAAGGPARLIVSGLEMAPADIEARIKSAVRLFLDGIRKR